MLFGAAAVLDDEGDRVGLAEVKFLVGSDVDDGRSDVDDDRAMASAERGRCPVKLVVRK